MSVFLTGGTGFLGRHLLDRLTRAGHDVMVLVNAPDPAEGGRKIRAALQSIGAAPADTRVVPILGDLRRPDLGLAPADCDRVLETVDWFIHCGAHVRFDAPIDAARRVNVGGTVALLELAQARQRHGRMSRFDYVSTAFVAGHRTGVVGEDELDGRYGHRNAYELTKFEAERTVREARDRLPVTIVRPSVIVGDSRTGKTTSFHMIYWPARIYAAGIWRVCPGNPAAPVDLVPVNVVADAMLELARDGRTLGRCFHLTAGPAGAATLRDMADLLHRRFPQRRPVRFVQPGPWMRYVHPVLKYTTVGTLRRTIRAGEHFVPYFISNPQFDNSGATQFLAGTSVSIPHVREYWNQLLDYCVESDWGRRPPVPAREKHACSLSTD